MHTIKSTLLQISESKSWPTEQVVTRVTTSLMAAQRQEQRPLMVLTLHMISKRLQWWGMYYQKRGPETSVKLCWRENCRRRAATEMDVMQQKLVYLVATLKAFICHYETLWGLSAIHLLLSAQCAGSVFSVCTFTRCVCFSLWCQFLVPNHTALLIVCNDICLHAIISSVMCHN